MPYLFLYSVMSGRVVLCWTSSKQGLMCLAQGHNTVTPMMLELATAWIGLGSNTLILSHCAPILNYIFFISWNCTRRPIEKHRSPLLVKADQNLRTLTAMVHAGMTAFYYFGMASRTDHHSPANCSLTQFLIFGCYLKTPKLIFGNDVFSKHLFPMVSYTQNTHKIPIPSNPRSTLLPSPLPRPLQPV